jgi:hypothetical protein
MLWSTRSPRQAEPEGRDRVEDEQPDRRDVVGDLALSPRGEDAERQRDAVADEHRDQCQRHRDLQSLAEFLRHRLTALDLTPEVAGQKSAPGLLAAVAHV